MLKLHLNKIIESIEPFILNSGFDKKGETRFIKKYKQDYSREELLSFTARAHRSDSNSIYIACTIGLYYPSVRKLEKNFIEDHLFKYPIVAGSISHFSPTGTFMSELYTPGRNEDDVIRKISWELKEGAFNLINTFPDLSSIYRGILAKHPYLSDYFQVYSERDYLTIVSIILLLKGKSEAVEWINDNYREGPTKSTLIEKIRSMP